MKKKYRVPEALIELLEKEDALTVSLGDDSMENDNGDGSGAEELFDQP